jgi:uncharacterized protein (TIGR00290 family)
MTNTSKKKILLSWSTGKDSAYALMQLKDEYEVLGLITTITKPFNRTSIHGTHRELLEKQAALIGTQLYAIEIPYPCSNKIYEKLMHNFFCTHSIVTEISHIAFGDIHLENVKKYRGEKLAKTKIKPLFPLWQRDSKTLAQEIIDAGIKAIIACIDTTKLDVSFLGREFDNDFLNDLPPTVDPCGENGEFHTFVYEAPMFREPIKIAPTEIIKQQGIAYIDIVYLP